MVVTFNDPKEFIEELEKEFVGFQGSEAVKRPRTPILRVTALFRGMSIEPWRKVYVCATIQNLSGDILRLETYCGQRWERGMEEDAKTEKKYGEIRNELVAAATGLGLEVRAGVIESPHGE